MMTKETPSEEKKSSNKGGKKEWNKVVVQVVQKPQHFLEGIFEFKID